ncbi:MAG TPA: molybdopterin-dependent oxidoreductase [Candidatus Methylacidiphilales bacterium]|nr:molybdopterin-dependent oxidoreductase [Candidatus Methylacidiphilales bacterium]
MNNPFNHDLTPADAPQINVQIDGVWMKFPKGLNAVEAARQAGKFVPHYCYHPKLSISGNCRMCLIEMGMPKLDAERKPVLAADGKPEIAWIPRPQIGCATLVSEGMGLRTESPLVDECRRGVMEFLLINHPLDCPICDQAGECKLQEYSVQYGNEGSRFTDDKVKKPKRVDIGERIVLDDERCIMCSRCIRFSREMVHDDVLGFIDRGSHTTLAVHPGKRLDNNYSLNTVDICPVGALTSKDFRFQMRVWFLKETKSICTGCATGCNTLIGSRENIVYRQTPRVNEAVNSHWMCDQGRLGFHYIHDEKRLTQPMAAVGQGKVLTPWETIIPRLATRLREFEPEQIAIIASGRLTNEEAFLLGQIRQALGGESVLADIVPRTGEADGILRSTDLNPNSHGVALFGLSNGGKTLSQIRQRIESGHIKALFITHENVFGDAGWPTGSLANLKLLAVQSILPCPACELADFVLPGASFAEKRGSMINGAGRLQRLNKAISPPGLSLDDWQILLQLKAALGGGNGLYTIEEVFKAMAAAQPIFTGLSLSKIGDLGIELKLQAPAPAAARPQPSPHPTV